MTMPSMRMPTSHLASRISDMPGHHQLNAAKQSLTIKAQTPAACSVLAGFGGLRGQPY